MNSIVIVNWEDIEFANKVSYSLQKQGYVLTEDYIDVGVRTQVWMKEADKNLRGRSIPASTQE